MSEHKHDRRFHGDPGRLRSPERIALLEIERVVSLSLEGIAAKSVLDIGSGTGIFAEAFKNAGLDAVGIDGNPEMVDAATQLLPQLKFRHGEAEALSFPARSFDLAFMRLLLHETTHPITALQEARRVARRRVVILEWPYRDEPHGAPLDERLRPEEIEEFIKAAEFPSWERIQLQHLELYRLNF